ncbi:MAG: CAP domain-containing protein [Candidatus Levyibacteriota bacterium]
MRRFFLHLFTPHHSNNYRAKILHHKILLIIVLAFFVGGFSLNYAKKTFPSVLGVVAGIDSQELLILTNQKRAEQGLTPLVIDERLSRAAEGKARDMLIGDYWSHISPDGKTPWIFIRSAGYNYEFAGENLARGFSNSSDVVSAWMNSSTHRNNMLSGKYNNVGFAIEQGKLNGEDTVLVVEMFGSISGQTVVAVNQAEATVQENIQVESSEKEQLTPSEEKLKEPTPLPIQEKSIKGNSIIASAKTPIVDASSFTRNFALIALLLFILVLVLDIIFVRKKKLVRVAGHNLDHILFFTLVMLIIVALTRGVIL